MRRFHLSPAAQADLDDIWTYTEGKWGADQAERYVRQIQAAITVIASDPSAGRSCNDIRPGYWRYKTGSHLLFFRRQENDVHIIRILHERMDTSRRL